MYLSVMYAYVLLIRTYVHGHFIRVHQTTGTCDISTRVFTAVLQVQMTHSTA